MHVLAYALTMCRVGLIDIQGDDAIHVPGHHRLCARLLTQKIETEPLLRIGTARYDG